MTILMLDLMCYFDPPPLREKLVIEHHQKDDTLAREWERLQFCLEKAGNTFLNNDNRIKEFMECAKGKATIVPAPIPALRSKGEPLLHAKTISFSKLVFYHDF
jgi:hypothetical protein